MLSIVLVLTTLVSYWYYLRVAWYMWMREGPSDGSHDGLYIPIPMQLALLAGVALILYTGVLPGAALEWARASVEGLGLAGGGVFGLAP